MNKRWNSFRARIARQDSVYQLLLLGVVCVLLCSCQRAWHYIPIGYDEAVAPEAPDYHLSEFWAALPSKADPADLVPADRFVDKQQEALVDCFYIHPTGFLEKDENWNADASNIDINAWTDEWPLRHQATAFNGSCKIYAPRYRQAHMKSFFHLEEGGKAALALAYQDVARAFTYFIENYSDDRPFVIVGHSQGTTHAQMLIRQFIDGQELQDRFVCAYLVGMPTKKDEFQHIPPCVVEADCGCFNSWTTFDKGYYPKFYDADYAQSAVINPLDWSATEKQASDFENHKGILVSSFKLKYAGSLSAMTHDGMLWVSKPKVPILKHFVWENNWHKADFNLFWVNIRNNVQKRVDSFLDFPPQSTSTN